MRTLGSGFIAFAASRPDVYNHPLVAPDFTVPERLECDGYMLRMLSIDDLELDYEAVTASTERLKGLFDPNSTWPEGLTRRDDLVDLGWHEREFTLRHSFAYTVIALGGVRCLGCCYIFPSNVPGADASVFYWVRAGSTTRSLTYDAAGNIATDSRSGGPYTYGTNKANRMNTVTVAGTVRGTYVYNGLSQLISRVITNYGTANGTL